MLKINKRFLIALLTFALPFGCVGCSDGASATYDQISGAEAKALMDSESGYIIIDARTQEEYDEGHIPGAILIPYGCGNYYIDDLDVTLLNYSFEPNAKKEVFDQVLKIATLFAKYGVTDVHTHCISIDGESRIVSVTQAKVKY